MGNAMIPQRNKSLRSQYFVRLKEANDEKQKKSIPEPNYFKKIAWFRAPYYSGSQLAYLESEQEMLHAVCGGCDLLMFGGEKVILNIDFKTASYEVTDLDQVLYALGVDNNPYCFIDTCLLSGFDARRTFEPLTLQNNKSKSATTKTSSRRNFSYQFSLEQVLKKGSGIAVITENLCTFNDAASVRSYHTNYTQTTCAKSVRSLPVRSKDDENIDKILQHMLSDKNEDDKKENPKYREYLDLYLIVRERVTAAKVLSFNGETTIYRPFKWMNEQLTQQSIDNHLNDNQTKSNENIPSNVYRLLAVGILSTFLASAIFGGHLIDTTPLIDSQELESAMNSMLPLRQRILDIFQSSFKTKNGISLQRWFQPNRDLKIKHNTDWTTKWIKKYKQCLNLLFDADLNTIDEQASIALVTPLKMLKNIKITKKTQLSLSLNKPCNDNWKIPQIQFISQLLCAAYLGTLITLNYISDNCALSNVAMTLCKINKFEFETILCIEMLSNEDLTEKAFTLIDENGKIYQIDQMIANKKIEMTQESVSKRRTLRLLARICSLLPMRPFIDGKTAWTAKLSYSLASFNHVVTNYHNSIKNCIEAAIAWIYCYSDDNNEVLTQPDFLKALALSLKQLPPSPCSGMGVLITEFVTSFASKEWNENNKKGADDFTKMKLLHNQLEELKKKYPVFTKIHFAIQCCMQFFYQICTLVKELGDMKVLKRAIVVQFEDAYEYLRELGIWEAIYFMEVKQNEKKKKT